MNGLAELVYRSQRSGFREDAPPPPAPASPPALPPVRRSESEQLDAFVRECCRIHRVRWVESRRSPITMALEFYWCVDGRVFSRLVNMLAVECDGQRGLENAAIELMQAIEASSHWLMHGTVEGSGELL